MWILLVRSLCFLTNIPLELKVKLRPDCATGAAPKGKSKSKKGKGSSQQPPASSDASNTTSKPAKQAKGVSTLSAAQLARIDAAEREQNALKTALKAVRTRLAVVHQKVELPSAAALERPVALLAVSGSTTSVSSSFSGGRAGGMYDAPFQSVSLGDVQVSNNMYAVPSYYQGQSKSVNAVVRSCFLLRHLMYRCESAGV